MKTEKGVRESRTKEETREKREKMDIVRKLTKETVEQSSIKRREKWKKNWKRGWCVRVSTLSEPKVAGRALRAEARCPVADLPHLWLEWAWWRRGDRLISPSLDLPILPFDLWPCLMHLSRRLWIS